MNGYKEEEGRKKKTHMRKTVAELADEEEVLPGENVESSSF